MPESNQHSGQLLAISNALVHAYAPGDAMYREAMHALDGLIEQLEAEAQYRVKAEQAIARLEEAVRVCGRHLYDCCRSDINWKLQIETHDQAVNAVAWVECDEPYPQKAQR